MSNNNLPTEISSIINKYVNGKATEKEIEFLNLYYESFEGLPEILNSKSAEERKRLKEEILGRVNAVIAEKEYKKGKVISFNSSRFWYRMAGAASLIFFIAFSLYFFNYKPSSEIAKTTDKTNKINNDVAPGGNRAILQLADGSTIILDSSSNGNIANQGQTTIIKIDGQLAYNSAGASTEVLYNTISTPRGGQYQLILADGSKVWLNAASSLRFPTSFTGKERNVTLTGEGYFEVAKNANMPFKVDVAGKGEVEVLGTHFNVNAYDDEAAIKTTLLEGAVKSNFANKTMLLSANQQSVFKIAAGTIHMQKEVDVNKVIAWKNGQFDFDDDDITDIMRQLGRWYDVEIQYNGKISAQHFTGAIPRKVAISKVLQMLEQAGGVHYKINNKTIEIKTD